jgi:rhomboid-like protein
MREQTKADPPMLESTGAFHFLAFFTSGAAFPLSPLTHR